MNFYVGNVRKKFTFLSSPLALLVLGACGGGGGGVSSGPAGGASGGSSSSTVGGNVVKGPLSNALVGLDYDGDGVVDSSTVRTGADGSYSLTTTNSTYTVIAVADEATIDTSSGTVLSGITLKAPKGASVVTPTTTLIEEAGITKEQVAEVLGLPDGVDPLSFNPYATGVNAADALAVEKASQQIMSVVNAFAGAAEGSGATEAEAFNAALNSVVEVVKTKATKLSDASASAADKTLDLTKASDLALVKAEVATKVAAETSADTTAFNALADDTASAVKNVNAKIATVTDLSSDAAKDTFSTTHVLADQTKQAAEAEVQSAGSGSIDFTDTNKVDAAAANKAPTDITLSNSAVAEDASSLVIVTLTTTDSDQTSGVVHTYKIAELSGTDYAAFSINAATGELSFKAQPDFETKSSYSITILSTDEGGKTYSKSFTISVTDANEVPTLTVPTGGTVTEDASTSTITGGLSSSDPEDDAPTYSVVGATASSGSYTVTGTYGTLTLSASTGAYTYALNNSASGVQALGASDSATESFSVQVTDGTNTPAAQTLSFTIQGANDAPSAPTLDNSSIDENVAGDTVGTLSSTDAEGDSVSYEIASGGDGASFEIDGSTLKLKDSVTADREAKGSYTVTVNADDGTDSQSSTFTITVGDANEVPTLTVPTGGTVTEDASTSTITGSLSSSDPEDDAPTYSVVGATASSGSYTVTGTYGTLTLSASTGAYTYALNNSASGVQALGASDSATESFSVQVTDGTNTPAAQTLSFTIQGANDAPSAPTLDNSSIDENVAGDTVGTLSSTDAEGDSVSYEIASGGDGASFEIDGSTLKLKDSVTADREAKGSYTVTINADDGTDSQSSTFTITVTNANVNTVPTPQNFSAETLQNIYDGVDSFSLNADSERIYTLSSDKPNVAVAVSVERPSGTVEGLFAVAKHTHDDSEVSIGVLSHHELFRAALGRDPSTDGSARLVANFINEVAPANQLPDSDLPLKILSVGSNPYFSTRQIDGERYTYTDAVDSNEIEGRIHGGFNYEIDTLRADDRHLVVEDILGPQRDWATDYDVVILRPSYERKYIDMALDWAASTGGSLLFSFDAGSFPNNPSYVAPHPEFLDFVENDLGIAIGEPGRLESDTTDLDDYSVTRINPFTTVNLRNYLGLTDGVPGTDASQPLQVTSEMNLVSVATDQNGLKVGDVSWSSSNEAIVSNSGELKAAGSATLAATINGVDGNTYFVNTYIKAFPLLDENGNSLTQGLTFDIVGWDDDVSKNSDNVTRNFNRVDQTYKDENNIFNLTEIENSGDLLYSFLSADLWIDDRIAGAGIFETINTSKTTSYSNNLKDEINAELSVSDQPIVAVVSGFIIANETGTHNIKLSAPDKQSELWIETEIGVRNHYVDKQDEGNGFLDLSAELKAGEHYKVVALFRDQNKNKDWFELTWQEPSSSEYSAIPASNLIARPPQSAVDGNTAGNFFDITDDNYVAPSGTADAVSQSPTSGSNNYDVVWEDVLYDSNYDSGLRFAKSEKFSLDQEYFQAPIQNLILTDTLITEAKSVSLNVYDGSSNELIYAMYNWDFESNAVTSLADFSDKLQAKLREELGSTDLTVTALNGVVKIEAAANDNYLFEELIVGKSPTLTPDTVDLTQAVSGITPGTLSQMARFSFEADGYFLNNVKVYQKVDPAFDWPTPLPDLRVAKQGFIGDNDSDYADQDEYDSAWARHGALEKSLNYYTGDRWDIQIVSDELVFKVDRDDGNGFVSVTPSKVELHSSSLYDDLIESISEAGRKYSDISIGEIRGEIALDSSDLAPSSPIKIIEQPIYGSVTMSQTGEYKYTPTSEKFKGLDQFHIEITDLHGVEHIQQVVIGKNVPLVDETSEFSEITITEKEYSEPDSSSYDSSTTAGQWSFEDVFFAQVAVHRPDNPYLSLVQGRPVTLKLNVSSNGSTNAPKFEVKVYDIDGVLVGSRVLIGPQKMPTAIELDLPSLTNLATDAGHNNDDSYTVEIPGNWLTPGMKIELLANNERINDRTDFIEAYNNTRDTNVAGDYLTPNVIGGGSSDFSIGHFSLGAFNTSYAYVGTTDFAMEMLARIPAESINLLYRSGSTIVETVRNRTDIDASTIISSDHSLAAGSATYIEMVDTPFGAGVPGWARNLAQAVKKANFLSPLDDTRYPDWMYSSILPDVGGGVGGGQTGSGNTAITATIHEFLGHGAGIGHPSDGVKTGHVYNNVSGTDFNWVLTDADSGNSYEKLGNLGDNWYYDQNSNTYIPNFYVTNIDDIVEAVQKAIAYASDPNNLNTVNGDPLLYQELANFIIEVPHLGAKGPILNLAEVIEIGSRLPTMYSVKDGAFEQENDTNKVFVESISPIYDLRTGPMAGSAGKGSLGQENFSTLIAPFSDFEMHTNLYDRFSNLMQWRPNQTLGQDTEDGGFAGDGYYEYWGLEKDIFTVEDLTGVTGDTRKITGIKYSDAIFDYSQRYEEYGDNLTEDEGGLSSVFKTENGQSLQAGKTEFLQLLDDDPSIYFYLKNISTSNTPQAQLGIAIRPPAKFRPPIISILHKLSPSFRTVKHAAL